MLPVAGAMSFLRVQAWVLLAAVAVWLAALAGRQFGLAGTVYSAVSLVTAVLLAGLTGAVAGGRAWGRVRRAVRRGAARAALARPAFITEGHTGGPAAAAEGDLAWQAVAATGAVGCAAVVVCDGGSAQPGPVYCAAGRSGRRGLGIGPDTRFEIGSLTKVFTGLLLADMAVRGEVDLDSPLGALPGIPAAAVTLRALATHTSGLPRRITGPRPGPLLTAHPDPFRGTTVTHLIAALARRPAPVPGAYRYSNVGYQLLAAALAAAAGTPWPDLLARRICAPLGLTATGMSPDENTARGHDQHGFPFPYADYTLLPGAIGLLSSPRDLARFLAAQLDPGSTPLGPAIRLSRVVHTPPGCRRPSGLGWRLKTTGDATLAWHRGLTHGFAAVLALTTTPGHPCGVAVLTNSPHTDGLQAAGLDALR